MSYTVKELNAAIKAWDTESNKSEGGWGTLAEELEWGEGSVHLPEIGTVEKVTGHGGEGEGDSYWIIVSVTDAAGVKRLFRRDGWYASYQGGYYDGDTEEVEAFEKTVTRYRKI